VKRLNRLIATPVQSNRSPLARWMTPEIIRHLGLTVTRLSPVTRLVDSGDISALNIPKTIEAGAPRYTLQRDADCEVAPSAISVTSWELALLSALEVTVVHQVLNAIHDSGIPVYLRMSTGSNCAAVSLVQMAADATRFQDQCRHIPAQPTTIAEDRAGTQLGLPIDAIKTLDVVGLRTCLRRWTEFRSKTPEVRAVSHTRIPSSWTITVPDRIASDSRLLTQCTPAELATIIPQISEIELTSAQYDQFQSVLHRMPPLKITLLAATLDEAVQHLSASGGPIITQLSVAGPPMPMDNAREFLDCHQGIQLLDTPVIVSHHDLEDPVLSRLAHIEFKETTLNADTLPKWI